MIARYWRRCWACKGSFRSTVPADDPDRKTRCPFCRVTLPEPGVRMDRAAAR